MKTAAEIIQAKDTQATNASKRGKSRLQRTKTILHLLAISTSTTPYYYTHNGNVTYLPQEALASKRQHHVLNNLQSATS